jgi:hypothetical protein
MSVGKWLIISQRPSRDTQREIVDPWGGWDDEDEEEEDDSDSGDDSDGDNTII